MRAAALTIAHRCLRHARGVAVVVPVYDAVDDLAACLDALCRHAPRWAQIILIDDASRDPRVAPLLREACVRREGVRLERNPSNLGYTATVNRGIELAGAADVVLLNSDTLPPPRFVEHLRAAAYSGARVGTATPLSDNASAFSAPRRGGGNRTLDPAEAERLQRVLARTSRRSYPRVPTGHGFCMYLRRDCIEATGLLDAEAFPRGYGEENDFCLRAAARGWRHVIDDATYVPHRRGSSFGAEREPLLARSRAVLDARWPGYRRLVRRHFAKPSVRRARAGVARASAALADAASGRPRILYAVATTVGGTAHTNEDLMTALADRIEPWLLRGRERGVELARWSPEGERRAARRGFLRRLRPFPHTSGEYERAVAEWLLRSGIELLHVRHLLWHSLELPRIARGLGIPVVHSFHDYYAVCPTLRLVDAEGRFCGGHCTAGSEDCRYAQWRRGGLPRLKHHAVHRWRASMDAALAPVDAFVTTSEPARELIRAHMPATRQRPFHVIPHGRNLPEVRQLARRPAPDEPVRVLLPGNLSVTKGAEIVRAVAELDAGRRFEFHVLGRAGTRLQGVPGVVLHGPYARERFLELAAGIQPHFGAVLSIWAETWCHTLTECWAAGLPVAVYDFGVVAERVRATGAGWVLPEVSACSTLAGLRRIIADPAGFADAVAGVHAWQRTQARADGAAEMAQRYRAVYRELAGGL